MNVEREGGSEEKESWIAGIAYLGGDGSVPGRAIVIHGARTHAEGARAEKRYLAHLFGVEGTDWQLQRQSLIVDDTNAFDEITVEKASGETETLYFEVSEFFGKEA